LFSARALRIAFLAGLGGLSAFAQNASSRTAELRSWRVAAGEFGPVIEVLATRPLTPKIQVVENPLRLVIDLPGSIIGTARTRISFRNEQIKSIRLNQFQSVPPVSRIVLDLAVPVQYTWDAKGNRLNVRVRPDDAARAKPKSVVGLSAGPEQVAVPVAIGTSGTLVETGSRVASGSSITAGDEIAVLRLRRGGEVRVCPGTTVSVATSPTGQELMLGMSRGAMETHYAVAESVDSVLTPDFRIVMPGPGEFNLAISTNAKGDTCVGSLAGSTSSAVVAELLGSGTYEIKPEQQVMFRAGRLDSIAAPLVACGCPTAPAPVLRASADNNNVISEDEAGPKLQLQNSETPAGGPTAGDSAPPNPGSDPSKADEKPDTQASLVFSGEEVAKARQRNAKIPAAPTAEAAKLPLSTRAQDPLPAVVVLPPAEPQRKGFFGKVKGFFGSIFR
jgi:AMIN domain